MKPEKYPGLYGIQTFDTIWIFSGSLYAAAKISSINAIIILNLKQVGK